MIWKKTLEMLMSGAWSRVSVNLSVYLPLQVLYAILIPALAMRRYKLAYTLLNKCSQTVGGKKTAFCKILHCGGVMGHVELNRALDYNSEVPVSVRLIDVLWRACEQVMHVREVYDELFDKVEYLIHLNFRYENRFEYNQEAPKGRFSMKKYSRAGAENLLDDDIDGIIDAGFFDKKREELMKLITR
jgi:hypothetical protein